MNVDDTIKNAITVAIAVVGWIVANHFTTKRDKSLKRQEIKLKYLIDAYKFLADDIEQRELNTETARKLETIIADIQLFGSLKQVELTKKLADDLV